MPTRSTMPPSASTSKSYAHPGQFVKKAYLMAFGLAFALNLVLALSVSSTGKDILRHLGVRHAAIAGNE